MCGIAGLFKFDGSVTKDDVAAVERMNDILFLRGPDGGGVFADDKTVLANRRLAIIDLSDAGKQPLSNDAQTVTVTSMARSTISLNCAACLSKRDTVSSPTPIPKF